MRNAQAIIVRQTLDEQFLELLRAQVRDNTERAGRMPAATAEPPADDDDDHCMGCMQVRASIRLLRQCALAAPQPGLPRCDGTACFCRPMWCLDWCVAGRRPRRPRTAVDICVGPGRGRARARAGGPSFGRWFLSQQDVRRPDTWLAGSSHCPTCRSRFCLRDIVAVTPAALGA